MADTNDADKLRAERDALEKRVEKLEDRPARRRKVRAVFTAIVLILAVLCFAVAVPGLWARRTVFNTERYVETVAPLASDPAVQEYLARTITEEAFVRLEAPVGRVGAPPVPMPFSPPLENFCIPEADAIVTGVRKTMAAS